VRFHGTITKLDGEQHMVWGYASTEAQDDQGEVVRHEALAAALDRYMRFANIREMHRNSAVGVATEAELDGKGLYLGARIVDEGAWEKVVAGVYKGFSIGGRITARDPGDRRIITGLELTEISVVDRPANPEAVFDCWKLAAGGASETDAASSGIAKLPVQVWHCGTAAHRYLAKADAVQCLERQGSDGGAAVLPEAELDGDGLASPGPARERSDADLFALVHQCLGELAARRGYPAPGAAVAKAADPDPLAKALTEQLVSRLDALAERVEAIAQTPLPPLTMARHPAGLSRREDGGLWPVSTDDVIAALAGMSDDERTLALIKAAHANPIQTAGFRGR